MKALNNTKSKDLFKKYEKPVQTPEMVLNNLEAKLVATTVGIDLSEMNNLNWFFELITKIKLPQNYKRYLSDDKDTVIYVNEMTHQETVEHPSINLLKTLFYSTLANNKVVYSFIEKESKLLPFVEEKMIRQCIGLSSKRRDAEKINLQRDQNGKMVMSKLQRINPDVKSLLSSRSYMLKMLVEKVFTRREVIGKSKRTNAYLNTIGEVKKAMKQLQPQNDEEYDSEENLELYQKIFQQASHHYMIQFGNIQKIPMRVINSKDYLESTPQNVLKNIFLLNIDKDSIQLYWLARIMDCLPLPHNWSKKKGASFDSYTYEPQKLLFDIHPSYIYILNQINKFKYVFKELGATRQNYYYNMRQLTFFDFFERAYSVDMFGYIESNMKKSSGKKKNKKRDRKMSKNEQVSDWMVIQGMKNSPITSDNYVLLEQIQRYWSSLDFKMQPWSPAISPFGEVVWSSNINQKSMSFNPYKPKLSSIVNNSLQQLPEITNDVLKKEYQTLNEQNEDDLLMLDTEAIRKQRQQFLDYFLSHDDKAVPWPYELKSKFQLIDQNIYFQQIFTSPFELDKDVVKEGQQVPFWLQKCRAKKHTSDNINLLLFNPEDYTEIKQKISQYAMDMVGEHEPHLLQETQKKINRISNAQELIKFLSYVNDLDLRQQRKKEHLQSLQIDSDSDIFGSDISQMEVNQEMDEESVHQVVVEEEQEEDTSKSSQKEVQPESEEQQEDFIKPIEIEIESEKEPEPPREEYQFLQNFKKRRYLRNWQLDLAATEELNKLLNSELSKKRRKCKYKNGVLKQKVTRQLKICKRIQNQECFGMLDHETQTTLNNMKRNMITTHLRQALVPYNERQRKQFQMFNDISEKRSDMNYSQITDYQDFRSQINDYDTSEIQQLISQEKERKRKRTKIVTQSQDDHQIQHEVTQDTIQLQPIYQVKPNIAFDPVLRHIKGLSGELQDFRKTFNQKSKVNKLEKTQSAQFGRISIISKSGSLKNIRNPEINFQTTPVSLLRNSSLRNSGKMSIQPKIGLTKREGMGSIPKFDTQKPFHRVCLDSTASHFLGKEAFLRKGDIMTMEARKSLLSKGRGLQTYISKFY